MFKRVLPPLSAAGSIAATVSRPSTTSSSTCSRRSPAGSIAAASTGAGGKPGNGCSRRSPAGSIAASGSRTASKQPGCSGGVSLSCPLLSHAPARASSRVLFRDARRGHLPGRWTGWRPCPAGPRRRVQGRHGPAQTTAGLRALLLRAYPVRHLAVSPPVAPQVFLGDDRRSQPHAGQTRRRPYLAGVRGRLIQGRWFVPTTSGVLQAPPVTARRHALRHRTAALPGGHPGFSLGWRCLAVPAAVRAAVAAPPGSPSRSNPSPGFPSVTAGYVTDTRHHGLLHVSSAP